MWYTADTETGLIGTAAKAPPLVVVSWATPREDIPLKAARAEVQASEDEDDEPVTTLTQAYVQDSGLVRWDEAEDFCAHLFDNTTVWANASYDLGVIIQQFPRLIDNVFRALDDDRVYDVLLREKLLDIARGWYNRISYSVFGLTKDRFKIELEKDIFRLRYMEFRDIPVEEWPQGAQDYARIDAEILWPLFAAQERDAGQYNRIDVLGTNRNLFDCEAHQVRADMALHLASAWGVRTEPERVHALARDVRWELRQLRKQLRDLGLVGKKGSRKTKVAKRRLLDTLGYDGVKLTDTGYRRVLLAEERVKRQYGREWYRDGAGIVAGERAIEEAERSAIDEGLIKVDEGSCHRTRRNDLIQYARYSHLLKLNGTYLPPLEAGMYAPVHTRFNALRETSRTSSSEPNLQNPPRKDGVRECFVPRPGHLYAAADYDKAELCSLAQMCFEQFGFSRLREVLIAGRDPHLDMAAQILGISYDEAKARKKVKDPVVGRTRTLAKAANFGFPGGLGVQAFIDFALNAYGLHLTEEKVRELKAQWFKTFPEMNEYFRWVNSLFPEVQDPEDPKRTIRARRTFIDYGTPAPYGTPGARPLFARGGVKYTVACNHFFQCRTAFAAKDALWGVAREQYLDRDTALYGTRTVLFLHDEIILEVPEEPDAAHEAAVRLGEVMVDAFKHYHPDLVEAVGASPCLMRRWYKDAEPVYRDGRLVPWEPRRGA